MPIPVPNKPAPFPRTWWVTDALLAGPYPGDHDKEIGKRKMRSILDAGVTVFVNLQEPAETGTGHRPFRDYRPEFQRLNERSMPDLEFHRFPIPDMGVTSKEAMREALDQIDEAHAEGRAVYIHCWGGHGRTGTVVGCWLVRHGLTPERALGQITELRKHDDYLTNQISPQTRAQIRMVREWTERLS